MDWPDFISKVGFPGAFAAMLAFALYRVAQWAKPFAERAVQSHFDLVEALNARDGVQAEQLVSIDTQLQKVATEITRTREMASDHFRSCELVHAANKPDPRTPHAPTESRSA